MTSDLLQRQAALAGVALLATIGALALGKEEVPGRVVVSGAAPTFPGWQEAVVGVHRGPYGAQTSCGVRLDRRVSGIVHPVLPCGAKLVVAHGGMMVRTEVVERGAAAAGHEFDLTVGLARRIDLRRTLRIQWRFAG